MATSTSDSASDRGGVHDWERDTILVVGLDDDWNTAIDSTLQPNWRATSPFAVDRCSLLMHPIGPSRRIYPQVPITLRSYQKELVELAEKGENAVLCAPTGSGKTICAAHIILNHLDTAVLLKRRAKVCFFVPTTALVEQQKKCLETYLKHRYRVDAFSGAIDDPRPVVETVLANVDALVVTPQIIVNVLGNQNAEDDENSLKGPTLSLSDFTLLVFDECHNATGNSPYNELLTAYVRLKLSNKPRPQLVGLSASPTFSGGWDLKKTVDIISEVCARFDACHLSDVKKHVDELARCAPVATDEVELVNGHDFGEKRRAFEKILSNFMAATENKLADWVKSNVPLNSYFEKISKNSASCGRTPIKAPPRRNAQDYISWCVFLIDETKKIPENLIPDNDRAFLIDTAFVLRIGIECLDILLHFSSRLAYKVLEYNFTKRSGTLATELSASVTDCLGELNAVVCDAAPVVDRIARLIDEALRKNDGRAVVFVQTRTSATMLADALNRNEMLTQVNCRSEQFCGLNSVGATDQLSLALPNEEWTSSEVRTAREQNERLARFREGSTNVLVATSVADEGLDISSCSLVIKVSLLSSWASLMQRRGRARRADSRCVFVTPREEMAKSESDTIDSLRLFQKALVHISRNPDDFVKLVKEAKEQLMRNVLMADDETYIPPTVVNPIRDLSQACLRCGKCNAEWCMLDKIRMDGSHFVAAEPKLWVRLTGCQISKEDQEKTHYDSVGRTSCKDCHSDMGTIVVERNSQLQLPTIAIKHAVCCWADAADPAHRELFKKWKSLLARVPGAKLPPLKASDIELMKREAPQVHFTSYKIDLAQS